MHKLLQYRFNQCSKNVSPTESDAIFFLRVAGHDKMPDKTSGVPSGERVHLRYIDRFNLILLFFFFNIVRYLIFILKSNLYRILAFFLDMGILSKALTYE